MGKALTVARTEYIRAVRTRGFILGVIMLPLLMGGSFLASKLSEKAADVSDRRFAVVDPTGVAWPVIVAAAEQHNEKEIWDDDGSGKQVEAKFVPELHVPEPGEDAALVLSDRVRREELAGFLIVGEGVLAPPGAAAGDRSVLWHTNNPSYDVLPRWIRTHLNTLATEHRLTAAGIDAGQVRDLSQPVWMRTMGLTVVTSGGQTRAGEETNKLATHMVPFALSMLLFMLVMSSAPALLNSVLEEKMQKIAEVLVAAVDPFDLLLGKLLSALAVALTLSAIYLGSGLLFLGSSDMVPPAVLEAITPQALAWYALFQILALLAFGSIYAAIGAACSEIQDAQNLMGPVLLLTVAPMFFIVTVLQNPDGPVSRIMSLIPTATPVLMMMRVSSPPGPAWWELVLAVVLTGGFAAGCVWIGGRIFRMAILSQGQAPTWRRLLAWARTK